MKYGHEWAFLEKVDFLANLAEKAHNNPTWFTNGWVVTALGILSLMELVADKSPEVREVIEEFSVYAKTGVAGLTSLGVLNTADAKIVGDMIEQSAGFLEVFPALLSAGMTYAGATLRNGVLGIFTEADPDDTVKVRGFISWIEDFLAVFGLWYLAAAPVVAFVVIGGFFGVLYLLRKHHEGKLEEAKIPCSNCGERIHSFATSCHHCGTAIEMPNILGFLGGIKEEKAKSVVDQKLRLMRLKRSPLSGERFEGKGVALKCEADGTTAFSDPELTRTYIDSVAAKLPKSLIVGAVLGFVPILGLIAGVIYYRLRLVAPFRRYLTFGQSFVTKWIVRLLLLALAVLQVSGGGFIAVPLMALINFLFYRSAFKRALEKENLVVAN